MEMTIAVTHVYIWWHVREMQFKYEAPPDVPFCNLIGQELQPISVPGCCPAECCSHLWAAPFPNSCLSEALGGEGALMLAPGTS